MINAHALDSIDRSPELKPDVSAIKDIKQYHQFRFTPMHLQQQEQQQLELIQQQQPPQANRQRRRLPKFVEGNSCRLQARMLSNTNMTVANSTNLVITLKNNPTNQQQIAQKSQKKKDEEGEQTKKPSSSSSSSTSSSSSSSPSSHRQKKRARSASKDKDPEFKLQPNRSNKRQKEK
jgi:hypothetical protein